MDVTGEPGHTDVSGDGRYWLRDRRLLFGFQSSDGTWVPGVLETVRDLQRQAVEIVERMDRRDLRDRTVERWYLRGLVAVVAVRFIGFEHFADILRLFGVH